MKLSFYEDREQTGVKHEILARYLSGAVPVLGSWASDIAYIDCLAGPWKNVSPDLADTSFARAIQVLRSTRRVLENRNKFPTFRCLLIEKDPAAFVQLRSFSEAVSDIEMLPKNWDFAEHVQDVVTFVRDRKQSFPFIFIDPRGWELAAIDLISPLLKLVPGEVLINLMTSWIKRFLSDSHKNFQPLLGSDAEKLKHLTGDDLEEGLVDSYTAAVRQAGDFKYVCTLPVMKPDQDAFHFYMVYATRNPKGVEVFKTTEKKIVPFMHTIRAQAQDRRRFQKSGQHVMFGPETTYREKRFTRMRQRNLMLAKEALKLELIKNKTVEYDIAWADSMQYSGVTEDDLRTWLSEWHSTGQLEVLNLRPKQHFPHRGECHLLRWRK